VLHYNWVRPHLSRSGRPPLDRYGGAGWERFREALRAALS